MITIDNYQDKKSTIDWKAMPKNIIETRNDVEEIMEFYNDDADIKETVDLFFKGINSNLPKVEKVAVQKVSKSPLVIYKEGKFITKKTLQSEYSFTDNENLAYTWAESEKSVAEQIAKGYDGLVIDMKEANRITKLMEAAKANREKTYPAKKKETLQDAFLDAKFTRSIMPKLQQIAVLENDESEEVQYFIDKIKEFERVFVAAAKQQDDIILMEKPVVAHFFYGKTDWYIIDFQPKENTFFGYVILNGDVQMSEAGYISIPELHTIKGIELDFGWNQKELGKVLHARYPDEFGDDEGEASTVINQKYGKKYVIAVLKDLGTDREATKRATKNLNSNTIKEIRAELIKDNFSGEYLDNTVIPKIKAQPTAQVTPKVTMVKKAKIEKVIDKTIVDNLSPEFLLIRRFWNIIKSETVHVPFRTVQLLYMAFNKAAVERKVRKVSEAAELFTACNKKIIMLFEEIPNNDKKPYEIEFTDKKLYNEIKEYVSDVAVNPAIPVLKRFIAIQNTKPDVKKAGALLKSMTKIIETSKENRLSPELSKARKELEDYIKKPSETIEPTIYGLSVPRSVCTNRIKCAGIDKSGKLHKGYKFQEHTGNVVKVRKSKLGSPNVCENRVKCTGLSKTGKLLPGYKFQEGTNHVVKVRKTTKKPIKKNTLKKKVAVGLGFSDNLQFNEVERIYVDNPIIPILNQNLEIQEEEIKQEPKIIATLSQPAKSTVKNKLMQMQFDSLDLDQGWEKFMQNPAKNMKVAIWGKPKNGKTAGSLQMADYFSKFGKVLYNFADQGFNKSTQDLWKMSGLANNANAEPSDVSTLDALEKEVATGKYTFVFIDMISDYINKENIKPYEFKERFMKKYPKVSFILIFEVTKGGDFKGDQGWTHIVDAIVTVEDFLMENRGRYGVGSHIVWEEGFKKFNPKRYEEVKAELEPEPALEFTEVERI